MRSIFAAAFVGVSIALSGSANASTYGWAKLKLDFVEEAFEKVHIRVYDGVPGWSDYKDYWDDWLTQDENIWGLRSPYNGLHGLEVDWTWEPLPGGVGTKMTCASPAGRLCAISSYLIDEVYKTIDSVIGKQIHFQVGLFGGGFIDGDVTTSFFTGGDVVAVWGYAGYGSYGNTPDGKYFETDSRDHWSKFRVVEMSAWESTQPPSVPAPPAIALLSAALPLPLLWRRLRRESRVRTRSRLIARR